MAATLGASACPDGSGVGDGRDQSGELGYAAFRWGCAGTGDLGCMAEEAFPRTVAVGSTYEVTARAGSRVPAEVDDDRVELVGSVRATESYAGLFEADAPGLVTLVSTSTDGQIIDYTVIDQQPVVGLALHDAADDVFPPECDKGQDCDGITGDAPRPLQFVTGRDTELRVEPLGSSGQRLMGALPYTWSVASEDDVASVLGSGNTARVHANREGQFELTVSTTDFSKTWTFGTVSEGPHRIRPERPDTGGETEGDTEGTGTDGTGTDGSGTDGSGTDGSGTDGSGTGGSSTGGGM